MKLAAILLLATLAGCGADPIQRVDTGSPGVTAALIAKVDGCLLYRVRDGSSETIYFARCPDRETTRWDRSCGKYCTKNIEVETP